MTIEYRTVTVRIPRSRMRIECRIFPKRNAMLQGIREDVIGGIGNSTVALTVTNTRSTRGDKNIASVVFFAKPTMDSDTVAHEMLHAAMNIMERRRKKSAMLIAFDDKTEEELACLVGSLVGSFNKTI